MLLLLAVMLAIALRASQTDPRDEFVGLESLEGSLALAISHNPRYEVMTEQGCVKVRLLEIKLHVRGTGTASPIELFACHQHVGIGEGEFFIHPSKERLSIRAPVPRKSAGEIPQDFQELRILESLGMHEG